jgi:hypothetical protein
MIEVDIIGGLQHTLSGRISNLLRGGVILLVAATGSSINIRSTVEMIREYRIHVQGSREDGPELI